jgi:hypothetical protein
LSAATGEPLLPYRLCLAPSRGIGLAVARRGEDPRVGIGRDAPVRPCPQRRREGFGKGVFRPCHIAGAHRQKREQAAIAFPGDALGKPVEDSCP